MGGIVGGNVGGRVEEVRWRGGGLYKWCGKVYVKYIEVSGGWGGGWDSGWECGWWGRGGEVERWWVI